MDYFSVPATPAELLIGAGVSAPKRQAPTHVPPSFELRLLGASDYGCAHRRVEARRRGILS